MIFTLLLSSAVCSATFAQRFHVGVRAGVNVSDFSIPAVAVDDALVRNGSSKAGFEAALAARLNITKHLNLQAEFEYGRVNYGFQYYAQGGTRRDITINTNRIEIPVMAGLNFGPVRLFCGPSFRISHNEKSNAPSLLKVGFNDSKVALTGGAGLNLKRFFLEGRLTGYPKASVNKFTVQGKTESVKAKHDMKWSVTAGLLF